MGQAIRACILMATFNVALHFAVLLGATPWRGWPPGDAHDWAFGVTLLAWWLMSSLTPTPQDEGRSPSARKAPDEQNPTPRKG